MKRLLFLFYLIILSSCTSASLSPNNLANEGTIAHLNKEGNRIIIYRLTSFNGTTSSSEIFKIDGNKLIFERKISLPDGTISVIFDSDDKNYLITKKAGSDFFLEKFSNKGDETIIYRSPERLTAIETVKEKTYLLRSMEVNREFSSKILLISEEKPKYLTNNLTRSVRIVGNSVLDTTNNSILYGDKVKNTPPPLPKDYVSNECSGDIDVTCFQTKEILDQRGYNSKQLRFATIKSTLGDCEVAEPISFLQQVIVSRNGRVIIYGALTNPSNGDKSLFINHYAGGSCNFTKLSVMGFN